jgi:hypothetical protein
MDTKQSNILSADSFEPWVMGGSNENDPAKTFVKSGSQEKIRWVMDQWFMVQPRSPIDAVLGWVKLPLYMCGGVTHPPATTYKHEGIMNKTPTFF